jgi:peptidoglycan/xylan/chitin deacetylase (PgdA/CDA1 family)
VSTPRGDRLTRTAQQRAEARAAALERAHRQRVLAIVGVVAVLLLPVAAVGLLSLDDKKDKSQKIHTTAKSTPAKGSATTPAANPAGAQSRTDVPILMYHVINAPKADTSLPDLWVSRENFQAQVDELKREGYEAVTLQRVYDAWKGKGSLPKKPIVLSFDDGYNSHFTNALPILKAKGWPGVENLQINQTQKDLTPDKVKTMIAAGWEVDVHTYSHPDLTTVDDSALKHEIADARAEIQQTYGVKANFFCYPAGKYNTHVIDAVKAAGFLGATTTVDGVATPDSAPFELPRIRINGSDGVQAFKDKVAVGSTNPGASVGE